MNKAVPILLAAAMLAGCGTYTNYGWEPRSAEQHFLLDVNACEGQAGQSIDLKNGDASTNMARQCLADLGYDDPAGWSWIKFRANVKDCEARTGQDGAYVFLGGAPGDTAKTASFEQCLRQRGYADPRRWVWFDCILPSEALIHCQRDHQLKLIEGRIVDQCRACGAHLSRPYGYGKFRFDSAACERETGEKSDAGNAPAPSPSFRRCMRNRGYGITGGP